MLMTAVPSRAHGSVVVVEPAGTVVVVVLQ